MVALNPTSPPAGCMTQQEVMGQMARHTPTLTQHVYVDRDWLWYCGPSLAGDGNKPTREALNLIGFRYSKRGHLMSDKKTVGKWGHSCTQPTFRRRRGSKGYRRKQSAPAITDDVLSMLASCGLD